MREPGSNQVKTEGDSRANTLSPDIQAQADDPALASPGQVPSAVSRVKFDDLMVRAAWLYHRHDWTQEQISQKFRVSRTTVARLLHRALQEGLVKISFDRAAEQLMLFEEELREKYALEEIILVPWSADPLALQTVLARAVAAFLERWLEDGTLLGVATSRTLNEMGDYFSPSRKLGKCVFVEMLGGIAADDPRFDTFNVSRKLAAACGGSAKHLLTPAVVSSSHVRDVLMQDERVAKTLELAATSEAALLAIGSAPQGVPLYQMANLTEEDYRQLRARGAVGEIMGHPYDIDGKAISHPVYDRVIGLDLQQVREFPFVIAVAGGREKELSVLGALRQHFIKVLVTDERTGLTLLHPPQ
jgi:DNA-binding transcriptional regulator LsrR (DeoR family)